MQKLIETEKKLEERIEKFRLQKEVVKTSYTAVAAEVRVTQAMTGVGKSFGNVSDSLRRAEDKVAGMRGRADAMDSLIQSGVLVDPLDNRPKEEREIDALRVGSAIDSDLETQSRACRRQEQHRWRTTAGALRWRGPSVRYQAARRMDRAQRSPSGFPRIKSGVNRSDVYVFSRLSR
jgi:hypothetical protein